jgi:hypothetical protein
VDSEVDRRFDDAANGARAGAMSGRRREPTFRGPTAVAVEDDRNRARDLRQVGLDQRLDARERAEAGEDADR